MPACFPRKNADAMLVSYACSGDYGDVGGLDSEGLRSPGLPYVPTYLTAVRSTYAVERVTSALGVRPLILTEYSVLSAWYERGEVRCLYVLYLVGKTVPRSGLAAGLRWQFNFGSPFYG